VTISAIIGNGGSADAFYTVTNTPSPPGFTTIPPNLTYAGWSVHPYGEVVKSVHSQWTVPAVLCNAPIGSRSWRESRAGVWVGIWGQGTDPIDSTVVWLAQIGTTSFCGDGGALHSDTAFAEFVHTSKNMGEYSDPGPKELFKVAPGDMIDATVTYYGVQHGAPGR
jgi:hypothetical protein